MKAMSYLTSSVARQGEYGSLPKVEMPENTESAFFVLLLLVSTSTEVGSISSGGITKQTHVLGYLHRLGECCTRVSYVVLREVLDRGGRHGPGRRWRRRLLLL